MKNCIYTTIILLICAISLHAEQLPDGYYDRANGKHDAELKTTLSSIIRKHTALSYGSGNNSSWYCFYYSDQDENGYCMDMYCDDWKKFTTPGAVVSGCNVEHSFAKSWWGGSNNDAYKDCFHLNPSNGTANSSRSNYPLGVPTQDFKSNTGSLKVGKRMENGELFYVFEPKDEYKGDFARAYFYMATCYGEELSWRKDNRDVGSYFAMRNSTDSAEYLEFLDWEIEVLLKWHRQDPVSEKEIKRVDAVSNFQHNHNPFVDYPCLAEYIWGDKKGEVVDMARLKNTADADWSTTADSSGCGCTYTEPTLMLPVAGSTFHIGSANRGEEISKNILLRGALLSKPMQLQIAGEDAALFRLAQTSVTAEEVNNGISIAIYYLPQAFGTNSATLTITGEEVNRTITLTGNCQYSFKALPATKITSSGFTANWTDAEVATYELDVYRKQITGNGLDTLIYLPACTQAAINANANISYSGKTYAESNSSIRLGTGSGDGTITINSTTLQTAKLTIVAAAYGSDASKLRVEADNEEVGNISLTTTATPYEFAIPADTKTITISQGTSGKRIIISTILLTTGGSTTTIERLNGFPTTVSGTEYTVSVDKAGKYYYTVTPLNKDISNEVEVNISGTETSLSELTYRAIRIDGTQIIISGITNGNAVRIYDTMGRVIFAETGRAEVKTTMPEHGIYIVTVGQLTTKIAL